LQVIKKNSAQEKMEEQFFQYFRTATAGFVFSQKQKDIPAHITGDDHEREVRMLITQVRRMAVKKSLQMPASFAGEFDRNDWIQLAMITMFHCCEKYDRQRPFDNYVRFMVSRRLVDKQRALFRKNPPVDRDVLRIYKELGQSMGDEQALQLLAEESGRSKEELKSIVAQGVGNRVFTQETEQSQRTAATAAASSPEMEAESSQDVSNLWHCVDRLSQRARALFIQHEMEEQSFKKIFAHAGCSKSFATFKRWYSADVFDRVKKCVQACYN
jgi:RNA polymerase sigma factor (sigma-70 family)